MKEGLTNKQYKYKQNDPEYKGEDLDDDLVNGPISNRGCTDIIFLIIFIAFIVGMIIISSIGFKQGQPKRLASPFDSLKNQCGYDLVDYKYIYILSSQQYQKFYCVKQCPTGSNFTIQYGSMNESQAAIVKQDTANEIPYKTTQIVSVCVPTDNALYQNITDTFNIPNMDKQLHDLKNTYEIILACVGIAMAIGFIFLVFMKYCSGVLIWGAIISYLVLLGVLGYLFLDESNQTSADEKLTTGGRDLGNKKDALKGLAITFWVVGAISAILVICFQRSIRLAISIVKATSEFIRDVFYIYLVPLGMILITVGFYAFWIAATVYLYSSGEIVKREIRTPFGGIIWNENIKNFLFYMIIALIWISEFLFAVTFFIIASSACIWYFNQGPGYNTGMSPIRTSVCRVFLHLGSLALGSFILTIIIVIKFILGYMTQKLKDSQVGGNACVQCALRIGLCCVDCFQRFIRFLNKNAYIQIALQGKGFCSAAADGFYLVLRNASRFAAVEGIGGIIMLVGKLFITFFTALIGYLIITKSSKYKNDIYSPVVPTIFFALVAYIVGYFFMSIYGVAADAILQSFLVDEEVHRKKGQSSNHCPAELRKYINQTD